jgi:hypothetical protein
MRNMVYLDTCFTGIHVLVALRKEHIANREQIMYIAVHRPLRGPASGAGVRGVAAGDLASVVGSQISGHKEHGS